MAEEQNQPNSANRPGAVVSPGSTPRQAAPTPSEPAPLPLPAAIDTPPQPDLPDPLPPADSGDFAAADSEDGVSWTAPEFMDNEKTASWYVGLAVAAAILAFFVYVFSKDVISVIVIIVVALIFGIYGRHKPRQLSFALQAVGVNVGGKIYLYDQFKSFSIKPEGGLLSLTFMPLRRFAPPLTIYYSPEVEEKIMKILTARMPYEEPRRDAVDSLMRRIRF